MTLGEKLKMLRASRGLSQEQLAAELNVSRQAVSKWECGDAAPDLDKLRAICTYFAVTTDYLIWENEEDTPKAAVPEKERALRGRNEVFSDVLLLVLLLAGIAALWNSLRLGFASRAALHIVLAVAAIAAAILSTTIWKQRGRVIALLIRRDRRSFGALPIGSYACLSDGSVVRVEIVCRRGRLADRLGERGDLAAA